MSRVTFVSYIKIPNDPGDDIKYELLYYGADAPIGTIALRAHGQNLAVFRKCPVTLGTAIQIALNEDAVSGRVVEQSLDELDIAIQRDLASAWDNLKDEATKFITQIGLPGGVTDGGGAAVAGMEGHRSLVAGFELYQLNQPITAESIEHASGLARRRLPITEANMDAWAKFAPLVDALKDQLTVIAARYAASRRMCRFGSRSRDIAAALSEFRGGLSDKWERGMADVSIQKAIFAEVGLEDALSKAQRAGQSIRRVRCDQNLFSNYCWQLNGDAWAKANPCDMAKRRRDLMARPDWMMRVHQGDLRPSDTFMGGAISHLVVAGGAVPYHTDTLFGKWRATSQTVALERSSDVDEHSVDDLSNHYIIIEAWMKATVGKNRDAAIWYDEQWVEAAHDMQRHGRAALELGMADFDVESLNAALIEIDLLTLQVNWQEVRYRADRALVSRNWPG